MTVNINDHDTPQEMLAAIREARSELQKKQTECRHRWEETDFGKKYWEPGTWQYTCQRCGKFSMVQIGVDHAT